MRPTSPIWRVFYTRPRHEKKVAHRLCEAGIDVCLPLRPVLRQWSDRKKEVMEPLFPSYLFAHVDERQRLDVLADEGVVKSVSFGGHAAEVRIEEIDMLRALESVPEHIEAVTRSAFPAGTPVIVTDGPLKGARGTVEDSRRSFYLTVDIASVHQAFRLQISADWVMRTAKTHEAVG